mgnify:CR=1 FL=1
MTAPSELFVDETVRDCIEEKMKKLFPGIDSYTVEVPSNWLDIWTDADFPESGEANVLYKVTDESKFLPGLEVTEYVGGRRVQHVPIARVRWKTKFTIVEDISGRYIQAEPSNIRVKRLISPKQWERIRR